MSIQKNQKGNGNLKQKHSVVLFRLFNHEPLKIQLAASFVLALNHLNLDIIALLHGDSNKWKNKILNTTNQRWGIEF